MALNSRCERAVIPWAPRLTRAAPAEPSRAPRCPPGRVQGRAGIGSLPVLFPRDPRPCATAASRGRREGTERSRDPLALWEEPSGGSLALPRPRPLRLPQPRPQPLPPGRGQMHRGRGNPKGDQGGGGDRRRRERTGGGGGNSDFS